MEHKPDLAHIDVRYVADLARVALSDEEAARYQRELDAILEYVAQLQELDVSGIEPTAHAVGQVNVLRDDRANETMPREKALANAPETLDDAMIRVPVVIEEEGF